MTDLSSIGLPEGFEFHHVGYATVSTSRERAFLESLGYQLDGEPFVDPTQGVSGCFMTGPGPRIELLQNIPGADTLTPWLNSGVKMYHLAYLVGDIHAATGWARAQRARITVDSVPAVAFGGRRISFALFRNGFLLEFIEN